MNCSRCNTEVPQARIDMGYTICTDCSTEEKVSCHTIYPHKTGGYIQPVSSEKSDELKRLDRRGVGGNKRAKGIFADNSWDKWLKSYYDNIYNKKPAKKISLKKIVNFSHMESRTLYQQIVKEFIQQGYHQAVEKVNELYSQDKISLVQKSKMIDNLAELGMMNRKEKKFFKKLEKDL